MKIPLVKWMSTPEGAWTISRLSTAILIVLLVSFNDFGTKIVPKYIYLPIFIFGVIIAFKSVFLFITRPEFKTMADAQPTKDFYQGSLYKYVRHPFYLGFWIFMLGVTLANLNFLIILLFILYTVLNFITIEKEEIRLMKIFQNYSDYQKKVPQFIPNNIKFIKSIFYD